MGQFSFLFWTTPNFGLRDQSPPCFNAGKGLPVGTMMRASKFSSHVAICFTASALILIAPSVATGNPHVSSPGLRRYPPATQVVEPSPQPVQTAPEVISEAEPETVPATPASDDGTLNIVCLGGGSAEKLDISTTDGTYSFSGSTDYGRGHFSGSGTSSETTYGTRDRAYADQVDVELANGTGRIRLPRQTLPIVRGGERGWFKLRNVEINDRTITASAAVNFINRPKVHIDRVTGTISINGMNGNYVGRCEAAERTSAKRF